MQPNHIAALIVSWRPSVGCVADDVVPVEERQDRPLEHRQDVEPEDGEEPQPHTEDDCRKRPDNPPAEFLEVVEGNGISPSLAIF